VLQGNISHTDKEEIIINLLSKEVEETLVNNLIDQCAKRILTTLENHYTKPPYVQQKEIMAELGVNYAYFKKLEAQGLKRVKIDPNDKTVFYKRSDVYALMDRLAEYG